MALVNMKDMLAKAKREEYAIGQFNINNLEWAIAILDEAEALKSPVILGVSEGASRYMGGYNTVANMIKGLIKDKKYTVPVALHLDHGSCFEECKRAIDAGFTSVMIDASNLPIDENIEMTLKVVNYALRHRASVEAELGSIGGQEDDISGEVIYADKHEAFRMVRETNIDALAPALGSVHGPYKGEPKIGFEEMFEIKELVEIPLVLHGGSGIPDRQIRKAIENGTAKINVNTELQQAWTEVVRDLLKNDKKVYDPRKIIGPGTAGIRKVVKEKIKLFGSDNRI